MKLLLVELNVVAACLALALQLLLIPLEAHFGDASASLGHWVELVASLFVALAACVG